MKLIIHYFLFFSSLLIFSSCSKDFEHVILVPKEVDIVFKIDFNAFEKKQQNLIKVMNTFLSKEETNLLQQFGVNTQKPIYVFEEFFDKESEKGIVFSILNVEKLKNQQIELKKKKENINGVSLIKISKKHTLLWKNEKAVLVNNYLHKEEITSYFFDERNSLAEQKSDFSSCIEKEHDLSYWVSLKNIHKIIPQFKKEEYDLSENSLNFFGDFNEGEAVFSMEYNGFEKYFLSNYLKQGVSQEMIDQLPKQEAQTYIGFAFSQEVIDLTLKELSSNEMGGFLLQAITNQPIHQVFTGEILHTRYQNELNYTILGTKDKAQTKQFLKGLGFMFIEDKFKHVLLNFTGNLNEKSVSFYQKRDNDEWSQGNIEVSKHVVKQLKNSPLAIYSKNNFDSADFEIVDDMNLSEIEIIDFSSTDKGQATLVLTMKNKEKNAFALLVK